MTLDLIHAGLFLVCTAYAFFLEWLDDRYIPNGTIFTVIVGNAFIGIALALICMNGLIGDGVYAPFWRLFWLDVTAGTPIAAWQFWQYLERRKRNKRNDATTKGRSTDAPKSRE